MNIQSQLLFAMQVKNDSVSSNSVIV